MKKIILHLLQNNMPNTISTKGLEKMLQKDLETPSVYEEALKSKEPEDDIGAIEIGDKETYLMFFMFLFIVFLYASGIWVAFSIIRWFNKLVF